MQQLAVLSFQDTPLVTDKEIDDICQGKIVRKLHVPDLPPELWIEILSYLPRGFVWKMIGINRMLFELGMNELYEDVRLTDYRGRNGLKTFQQIANENIASRVRSLYIRPTFLPTMNRRGRAVYDRHEDPVERKKRKVEIEVFFKTALSALRGCPNLREINVVVHDQYLPKSLANFLRKLIKRVGARLEALTIDMTLQSFLSVCRVFDPKHLEKLKALTIKVTNSRFETSKAQARSTREGLLWIIRPLQAKLQTLAFEVIDLNLSKIFKKLEKLPYLTSLELRAEIGFSTLIPTIHFTTFLQHNAQNLERLVIRRPTIDVPSSWNIEVIIERLYNLLCGQHLPKLKELVLEVDYTVILTSLASHVKTFVPHLKNLTLTGQCLTFDYSQLSSLLEGLAGGDKGLESLEISITRFSAVHMDLLATSLPNLKKLDLSYQILSSDEDPLFGRSNDIYDEFRKRSYSQWNLEEVRLVHVGICGRGHPDGKLLDAIEDIIPSLKMVDRTRGCDCECTSGCR